MELVKTKQRKIQKSKYVLKLEWMEGDADGYQDSEIHVDEEDYDNIEDVRNMLHELIELFQKGRDFEDHPHYSKYFSEDITEEDFDLFDKYFGAETDSKCIHHPTDCNYNDTRLESFKVLFYDEKGIKYNVEIKD